MDSGGIKEKDVGDGRTAVIVEPTYLEEGFLGDGWGGLLSGSATGFFKMGKNVGRK